MQTFQFEYSNSNNFRYELTRIKRECSRISNCKVVFNICYTFKDFNEVKEITDIIDEAIPEAYYFGSGAYGVICQGQAVNNDKAVIVCTIYESESTKVELLQIEPEDELYNPNDSNSILKNVVKNNNWVKSIDLIVSPAGCNLLNIFEELKFDHPVSIFGGVSINPNNVFDDVSYVFAKGYKPTSKGIVLLLLGGDDFHIKTSYVVGWKPVGKHLTASKTNGTQLLKIDDLSPMDIYKKYLGIENDEKFGMNAISFPLLINRNGIDCITTPVAANENGEISCLVPIPEGSSIRLSFGDVDTIVNSVNDNIDKIIDFGPECIRVYSCCGRAMYLQDNISIETKKLNEIAPTSGFYTRGELILVNDYLMLLNYTMVVGYLREGEKLTDSIGIENKVQENVAKELTNIDKLVKLISVTSNELEDALNKLNN